MAVQCHTTPGLPDEAPCESPRPAPAAGSRVELEPPPRRYSESDPSVNASYLHELCQMAEVLFYSHTEETKLTRMGFGALLTSISERADVLLSDLSEIEFQEEKARTRAKGGAQ